MHGTRATTIRGGALAAALLAALTLTPAAAGATEVVLGATAEEPSECTQPRARTASTSCQLFAGAPLHVVALASDEDGTTRLVPQPFTLERLARGKAPRPVLSWTHLGPNDNPDPRITPRGNSDYQARFGGNEALAPGVSQTLAVQVGIPLAIPTRSASGRSARLRIPVTVGVRSRAQRGRLELRLCRDPKRSEARACAGRRGHTVVATRTVRRAGRHSFAIALPPRTYRGYEVAFRPASGRFTVTRQAFKVQRGYDGRTTYRYTVRSAPFGNR